MDERLIPLTAPEVRWLVTQLVWTEKRQPASSCLGPTGDGGIRLGPKMPFPNYD